MDNIHRDEKRYRKYLEDVEIARTEITKMMLWPKTDLLCDLYAIPSHNFHSYYAMVYEDERLLKMVYAKTQIYMGFLPEPINMYSFKDAKAAEMHPVNRGSIIIGLKDVPDDLGIILKDILENMPEKHILGEAELFIDGMLQAIRMYKGKHVAKEIVYCDSKKIQLPQEKEYLRVQLEGSLYQRIEALIC